MNWNDGLTFDESMWMIYARQANELNHFLDSKGIPSSVYYNLTTVDNFIRGMFHKIHKQFRFYNRYKLPDEQTDHWSMTDQVLIWCLHHRIPKGKRNWILMKNLAAGLLRSKLDYKQRNNMCKILMMNCPDKPNRSDIYGWIKYFKNKGTAEYNKFEVNKWLRLHKLYDLLYKIKEVDKK